MKIAYILAFLAGSLFVAQGQEKNKYPDLPGNNDLTLEIRQQDFGENFTVIFGSEGDYDYYAVDLSKLAGEFERIFFLNLTYSEPRLINLDADLDKGHAWFKSYYLYKQEELTCLFNDLKEKTEQAAENMNINEKSAWMDKNNKFNIKGKNE